MTGRDVQPTLEQAPRSSWASQVAGSFVSGLALAPGPGPDSQAAPREGLCVGGLTILRWPVISSQQTNWRWSPPSHRAHLAQTPGRPVRAKLGHATCRVRRDSARFRRVPSRAVVRADRTGRGLPVLGSAVFPFKIGAKISLGITPCFPASNLELPSPFDRNTLFIFNRMDVHPNLGVFSRSSA